MTDKQTERTRCDYCHQFQYCRRVRKPKRVFGQTIYVFAYLCTICVYEIEIL
jgi:hypothetical protein